MIESIRTQFLVVLGELRAFVNDFLGEDKPSLGNCVGSQKINHVIICERGCVVRAFQDKKNADSCETAIFLLLEQLEKSNKTVAYLDCLQNIPKHISPKCHLLLYPDTAEDAFKMCLRLIELQAVSVIILDGWHRLPIASEQNLSMFQDNILERHRFFQSASLQLTQAALKNRINTLIV